MLGNIQDFLQLMLEAGASDLHITQDSPPLIRVHGTLRPLSYPPLTATDTRTLCYSLLTEAQKKKFEEESELDFSFAAKGVSRFRGNLFLQKGAVGGAFRTIPFEIPPLEKLGLPRGRARDGVAAARPGARHRPDRQRKVDDARRDHRQDQRDARRAHRHDRRSDRVRARAQEGAGQSARGLRRHARLRPRAQAHPAAGSRHRADRRDARPRDDRGGAGRRRDRPPGVLDAAHQLGGADDQPRHRRLPAAPAGAGPRAAVAGAPGVVSQQLLPRATDTAAVSPPRS